MHDHLRRLQLQAGTCENDVYVPARVMVWSLDHVALLPAE